MTAPLTPHPTPHITGDVVLKSAQDIAVSCPWCQRIMRACDGSLSLAEIAQKVHLPLKVCEKLVTKAVQENWLEVVSRRTPGRADTREVGGTPVGGAFWFEVNQVIYGSLGSAGTRLLQEAAQMTRLNGTELTRREVGNFLIALELAATEQERQQLNDHLDALRSRHAT